MKARWQFHFDSTGVRFEGKLKYGAQITADHAQEFGLPAEAFEAEINIEADETSRNPLVEQTGKLKITLPGDRKATEDLAYWLARYLVDQITFSQGVMKINYGLVLGEHLPENRDEIKQVGDKPCFGKVQLIQIPPPPIFKGGALMEVSASPLLRQFNAAKSAHNPIDQFLGLFKILEGLYGPRQSKKGIGIGNALKASKELFHLAQQHLHIAENGADRTLSESDFFRLVTTLVKTRHDCAHLRSEKSGPKKFGITHGDHRVTTEVLPLVPLLQTLAAEAIQLNAQP